MLGGPYYCLRCRGAGYFGSALTLGPPRSVRPSSGISSLHPPQTKDRRTCTKLLGRRETRPQLVHKTLTLWFDTIFSLLCAASRQHQLASTGQLWRRLAADTPAVLGSRDPEVKQSAERKEIPAALRQGLDRFDQISRNPKHTEPAAGKPNHRTPLLDGSLHLRQSDHDISYLIGGATKSRSDTQRSEITTWSQRSKTCGR